ncbi:MAG TPA: response regulator [Spirochaetia bacterium]|nr:response regulator [Spirochaetia bacterium]
MDTRGSPGVLVVDDEAALRSLLRRMLESEGFEPVCANDGEEAIRLFRDRSPLVVVSDIRMPRMDGLALLTEIRKIDREAAVILMTGQGNEDVLLRALRGGATNFFKKPFNSRELLDEIRRIVSFRQEAAGSARISPYLIEETMSFVLPVGAPGHGAVVNRIMQQLPNILPAEETLNLRIGIEEMITNAVEHGNLGISFEEKSSAIREGRLAELIAERTGEGRRAGRKVFITSRLAPDLFEVTIRDEGQGFDWRALPVVSPENLLAFNGRGIFLTKIYFDEVEYNEPGNQVTLRRRPRKPQN